MQNKRDIFEIVQNVKNDLNQESDARNVTLNTRTNLKQILI